MRLTEPRTEAKTIGLDMRLANTSPHIALQGKRASPSVSGKGYTSSDPLMDVWEDVEGVLVGGTANRPKVPGVSGRPEPVLCGVAAVDRNPNYCTCPPEPDPADRNSATFARRFNCPNAAGNVR